MAKNQEIMSTQTRNMLNRATSENPMLEADEELALHRAWTESGDISARNRMVMAHLPMAMKMVRKLGGYGMNPDDMIGYGIAGLLAAVDKFDPSRGVRFSACAQNWVKEKMLSYVIRNKSILRGPQTSAAKKMFFNLSKVKIALGFEGMLTPEEAVAVRDMMLLDNPALPGLTVSSILEFEQYRTTGVVSINPTTEEGTFSLVDTIPDEAEPVLDTIADDEISDLRLKFVHKAVKVLKDDRQRAIFIGRYVREPCLTLEQLSKMYGVSRERIRQVESRAVEKVRIATTAMMAAYEAEKRTASANHVN